MFGEIWFLDALLGHLKLVQGDTREFFHSVKLVSPFGMREARAQAQAEAKNAIKS